MEHIGGLSGNLLKWIKDFLIERQMRTVIKNCVSSWTTVTSRVPQGSVLAPIIFLIYVNDMVDGISSYASLFADDVKIMRRIKVEEDCSLLQEDLRKIYEWSQMWEMEFNAKKCKILEMGRSDKRTTGNYNIGPELIPKTKEKKDLGILIQDDLSPEKHINKIVSTTYQLLTSIKMAFNYMDEDMMKRTIVAIICPRLKYAAVAWSPHKIKDIRMIHKD